MDGSMLVSGRPLRKAVSTVAIGIVVVIILVVAAVGVYYYLQSTPKPATQTITIGASVPLTGAFSSFGTEELWAYQYAINQTNKAGGIHLSSCNCNATVKFVYYNDASNPDTTTSNTQRLISTDNATAILGSWASPLVFAGARVAQAVKVPFVSPGSADSVYDTGNYTYVFLPFLNITGNFAPTIQYIQSLPASQRPTKLALWVEDSSLGHDSAAAWSQVAQKAGINVVYQTTYETGLKDFSSIILATKASGANFVATIPTPPDAITMITQMKTLSYTPTVIDMPRGADQSAFAHAAGVSLSNGVIDAYCWDPYINTPGNAALVQAYTTSHPTALPPDAIGPAYTAAEVLMNAIARAGSTNGNAIRQALSTTHLETPEGLIIFPLGYGHSTFLPLVLQWQNLKPQVVWPSQYATASAIPLFSSSTT